MPLRRESLQPQELPFLFESTQAKGSRISDLSTTSLDPQLSHGVPFPPAPFPLNQEGRREMMEARTRAMFSTSVALSSPPVHASLSSPPPSVSFHPNRNPNTESRLGTKERRQLLGKDSFFGPNPVAATRHWETEWNGTERDDEEDMDMYIRSPRRLSSDSRPLSLCLTDQSA
uniref:Uncharacterized protein n=1 Tax=Palpitomonas bilix TaxID=652834 RepID=A0A7S3G859_9EUKA